MIYQNIKYICKKSNYLIMQENEKLYVFFDTETNGLPKNYKASPKDVDNWPRIIQFAFIVYDEKFNKVFEYCQLIKPDNWIIPNEKFWIDNGYTTEINSRDGFDIFDALNVFAGYLELCTHLVAHNIWFDYPLVCAEMIRLNMRVENRNIEKICTMKSTTNFCSLPRNKWPKLEELYQKLFGFKFDNAHDALADVRATAECFKYLDDNKLVTWHN